MGPVLSVGDLKVDPDPCWGYLRITQTCSQFCVLPQSVLFKDTNVEVLEQNYLMIIKPLIWAWWDRPVIPANGEAEARGSKTQGHPRLKGLFRARLDNLRPCLSVSKYGLKRGPGKGQW